MSSTIDSVIEEIKRHPVLGLVPIAGVFWLILRTYPGSIAIVPITSPQAPVSPFPASRIADYNNKQLILDSNMSTDKIVELYRNGYRL